MIPENIIDTKVTLIPSCLLLLAVLGISRLALAVVGFNIKKYLANERRQI
jgi:hypothetical protein